MFIVHSTYLTDYISTDGYDDMFPIFDSNNGKCICIDEIVDNSCQNSRINRRNEG
jgi:hypothetical protein